jgi:nuclear cap-binding protein subunit 1
MIVVIVDKMLKTQIVECIAVINWIFSDEMRNDLTKFYAWEILNSTLNRMNKQCDKLKIEYTQLKERNSIKSDIESNSDIVSNKINTMQCARLF